VIVERGRTAMLTFGNAPLRTHMAAGMAAWFEVA
jgi:hypothetical protein